MLGAEEGLPEIDGVDEGLIEGSTPCVGKSLGFWLGYTDCVGTILDLIRDGLIDSEGKTLGSVVGMRLMLGPMLAIDAGSTDIDGVEEGLIDGPILAVGTSLGCLLGDTDCVGTILGGDVPIDSEGNSLGSVVGVRLMLGPMLDTEKGSIDIDGVDEVLVVGSKILDFKDGAIDSDGNPLDSVIGA
eukprot:scaffold88369_cov72-Attheya_sp.AAC.6